MHDTKPGGTFQQTKLLWLTSVQRLFNMFNGLMPRINSFIVDRFTAIIKFYMQLIPILPNANERSN